jgi:ribosomal protein L29
VRKNEFDAKYHRYNRHLFLPLSQIKTIAMNKFMQDWVNSLDDLKVELNDLDDNLLADFFEQQKTKSQERLAEIRETVDSKFGEEANELRAKLDHLKVQLALGKAEGRDAFEEQKGKLDHAMRDAHNMANSMKDKLGTELGDDLHGLKQSLQTKMEVLRLKYALGKADAKDELEEVRKDLSHRVAVLKSKAQKRIEDSDADDKWDDFKDEMKEAFTHMKGAVRGLFS